MYLSPISLIEAVVCMHTMHTLYNVYVYACICLYTLSVLCILQQYTEHTQCTYTYACAESIQNLRLFGSLWFGRLIFSIWLEDWCFWYCELELIDFQYQCYNIFNVSVSIQGLWSILVKIIIQNLANGGNVSYTRFSIIQYFNRYGIYFWIWQWKTWQFSMKSIIMKLNLQWYFMYICIVCTLCTINYDNMYYTTYRKPKEESCPRISQFAISLMSAHEIWIKNRIFYIYEPLNDTMVIADQCAVNELWSIAWNISQQSLINIWKDLAIFQNVPLQTW